MPSISALELLLQNAQSHGLRLVCYKDMVNGRSPAEYNLPQLVDTLIKGNSISEGDKDRVLECLIQHTVDVRGLYPEGTHKVIHGDSAGVKKPFDTVVINLYGAPSTGKTTTVAELFSNFKKRGRHVLQIQEYASYLINAGRIRELKEEQDLIFTKQKHKQEIAQGKFEYAISESPLLLSSYYAPANYPDTFHTWVKDTVAKFKNLNFYLRKRDWSDYGQSGRIHDKAEAIAIERELIEFIKKMGQEVVEVPPGVDPTLWIADWISRYEEQQLLGKQAENSLAGK